MNIEKKSKETDLVIKKKTEKRRRLVKVQLQQFLGHEKWHILLNRKKIRQKHI